MLLDGDIYNETRKYITVLTQKERNAIFDTCVFDTIVEGYYISLMQELEKPKEEIKGGLSTLRGLFNDLDAEAVLGIREGFIQENGL